MEDGSGYGGFVHDSIWTVIRARPKYLSVGSTSQQVKQRRRIVGRSENGFVKLLADTCLMVGVSIKLAAHVQDVAPSKDTADRLCTCFVLRRPGHKKPSEDGLIMRRPPLAQLAPISITVPGDKANE